MYTLRFIAGMLLTQFYVAPDSICQRKKRDIP